MNKDRFEALYPWARRAEPKPDQSKKEHHQAPADQSRWYAMYPWSAVKDEPLSAL